MSWHNEGCIFAAYTDESLIINGMIEVDCLKEIRSRRMLIFIASLVSKLLSCPRLQWLKLHYGVMKNTSLAILESVVVIMGCHIGLVGIFELIKLFLQLTNLSFELGLCLL
jgi:hypothetical protein